MSLLESAESAALAIFLGFWKNCQRCEQDDHPFMFY